MEEDNEEVQKRATGTDRRMRGGGNQSNLKIEAWLSPLSDHFPTPRGFHFMAAPIVPGSPSTTSNDDDSSSPTNSSSNQWNRASVATDGTEFDDIYDVSDPEPPQRPRIPMRASSMRRPNAAQNLRQAAIGGRRALPPLVIPARRETSTESWSGVDLKKVMSPIAPTPTSRVEMSPAVMSFMQAQQAQDVPTISAPPSLDGSLTSEQMAAMSAPPTPIIGGSDSGRGEDWDGVHLQPGALATLHALSGDESPSEVQPEQVIEIPTPEMTQQPTRLFTNLPPRVPHDGDLTPSSTRSRRSFAGLTRLEIPSPGGFFSGLSPRTRNTWHMPSMSPDSLVPPTSTTAEQFYRCPWNISTEVPPVPPKPVEVTRVVSAPPLPMYGTDEQFYRIGIASGSPVEQVIEIHDDILVEDDMPTARPILPDHSTSSVTAAEPVSPDAEVVPTEIVVDYDPHYARKQQEEALSNLDRTELWLMAQKVYLKPVVATDDSDDEIAQVVEVVEEEVQRKEPEPELALTAPKKKTVRFSEVVILADMPCRLPSKLLRQESAYYRAFQDYIIRSRRQDAFVHRLPRFEALQAQRVSLREAHRSQLLGKYQLSVVPQSAKKRLSANVARGDDILIDDPEKLRREKEHEAYTQMSMSNWHVAAIKILNGGRLICAPVGKRLARVSRMAPGRDGVARDRARILDLGGQATCDWAWHCAFQYPNTKIYTVTTKAIRQLSNSNIRGPSNHRQVAVDRLTRLPFKDEQFDLISARELHSMLKFVGENGEDEWESCLRECMRVLKPGGYFEFSLLDSDVMNAGPIGLAKSVEFGFTLKTLGYDPTPTKMWLGRLTRAGFDEVRRAWLCMPMGERRPSKPPPIPLKDSPTGQEVKTLELEAMVTGSSDGAASVCGIVGGWSWERWLLRCEMERVAGELRLCDTVTNGAAMLEAGKCLDGVAAIVEEGRNCGAGWRLLNGYARKPRKGTDLISIGFAKA
jgi:SAM-dependent methyltransferase